MFFLNVTDAAAGIDSVHWFLCNEPYSQWPIIIIIIIIIIVSNIFSNIWRHAVA
jgi:hypothetical protein